jgi:phosphopantothenoylcysteine decarboxylase/phosphopantothenate--cysteine ligase
MRILITAGPTREPIDLVRFVGNRSSGKMGLALAEASVEAGHETTLLLGPVGAAPPPPEGCRTYRFESTAELKQLLEAHWRDHDVLIMAAAVADYRPIEVHEGKLPRNPDGTLTLVLHPTPDLAALMASSKRAGQSVIAFALEEKENLEARAVQKMRKKAVDAIVANPLGTMESDGITPVWLTADGSREAPGRMSKAEFARWLMRKLAT